MRGVPHGAGSLPHFLLESESSPGHCLAVTSLSPHASVASMASMASGSVGGGSPWTAVHELASGVDKPAGGTVLASNVIFHNGVRSPRTQLLNISAAAAAVAVSLSAHALSPTSPDPDALRQRHVPWTEHTFPAVDSQGTVNAMRDCGAVGDGIVDDHDALQRCLVGHDDVFLPKGIYRLSQTLRLRGGNRLLGVSQTHTVLVPVSSGFRAFARVRVNATGSAGEGDGEGDGGGRGGGGHQLMQPIVSTAAEGNVTIAFVGIMTWWHLSDTYTLEWNGGGLYRSNYDSRVCECLWMVNYGNLPPNDLRRRRAATPPCRPSVNLTAPKAVVRGHGSFIGYDNDEDIVMTDHQHYRHLLVTGQGTTPQTRGLHDDGGGGGGGRRLRFYGLNLEHAMSESNMEITHRTARAGGGVDIFGVKVEGSNTILTIRNSTDIRLYGFGGASDTFPNTSFLPADFRTRALRPALIRLDNVSGITLANCLDDPRGSLGKPPSPLGAFPTSAQALDSFANSTRLPWPDGDVAEIVHSQWAPWAGWRVDPSAWSLIVDSEGFEGDRLWSAPGDRPVLWEYT